MTRAADLKDGQMIDLLPTLREYAEGIDLAHDLALCEYATVDGTPDEAAPVNGIPAVVIYTDQHNFKLPADYEFEEVDA